MTPRLDTVSLQSPTPVPNLVPKLKVVDYTVESVYVGKGTYVHRRVPLDTGEVLMVSDTPFYMSPKVCADLLSVLGIFLYQVMMPRTILQIEDALQRIVCAAIDSGEVSLHDKSVGALIEAKPLYFTATPPPNV